MDITIIGTGNMGRGIATVAQAGGHSVTLLGTSADKAEALAGELGGDLRTGAVGDPIADEVVVLAVWFDAAQDVVARYGDQLDGKVLVDVSNAIDAATYQPVDIPAGSTAETLAAAAPGARLVKAFNTTFATTLVAREVAGQPLDVFVASDDEDAKAAVSLLVTDGGLRAIDAGPLAHASQIEALGYLHMAIQGPLGTGFGTAVKIIG